MRRWRRLSAIVTGLAFGLALVAGGPPSARAETPKDEAARLDNGARLVEVAADTQPMVSPEAGGETVLASIVRDGEVFSLVAVSWRSISGSEVTITLRARGASGWSAWQTVDPADAEMAPDGQATLTAPVWFGPSEAVEVLASGPPGSGVAGLHATLIDPGPAPAVAVIPLAAADVSTPEAEEPEAEEPEVEEPEVNVPPPSFIERPAILTRQAWGAAAQKDCNRLYNSTIQGVVIHHTAGSNEYSPADSASIVRGIQAYHLSRGWCDIGYNFLVDQYGTIFEGRGGGMELPVQGAHADAWNVNTVGVSFMMNSQTATPTPAALEAAEKLIAWKLANYYVDPLGTTRLAGKTLPVIFGHGEVMATACPGTNLISQLPAIRQAVADLIEAALPSPIEARWLDTGGASGPLGPPYKQESPLGDGGRVTVFAHGDIRLDAATGATTVRTCAEFTDVPTSHTFAESICWASWTGITKGSGDGTVYAPANPVNRGSMAAFLYRLAGSPKWTPPAVSPFVDVDKTHQFYSAITWLANQGITKGVVIGGRLYYQPANAVNRGSMAAFMRRLVGNPPNTTMVNPFTDLTRANQFHDAILWLADKKITVGSTVGGKLVYQSSNPVTRGSMAAFLRRLATTGLQCAVYSGAVGC